MNFAVLDFETTGNQPSDEIIQVGIVKVSQGEIVDRFQSYVKPSCLIPPFISSLTGITDDQVEHAPTLEEVITELLPFLNDRSEEHTSELQSRGHLVCRLLLEKKNIIRR